MSLDKPSGRSAPGSLPVLVAVCAAAGLGIGVAEGIVAQWISLLLLFPLIIGVVVGAAASSQVERGRIRAPLLAGAIAFGGGALGQIAVHGTEYGFFRSSVGAALGADPEAAGFTVDDALEAETGRRGFLGYLAIVSAEGITIGKAGRSSSGPALTGWGVWTLWGFEVLIAAGVAGSMAATRTREPFCEGCDRWYDHDDRITAGAPEKTAWTPFVAAAHTGAWGPALTALGAPGPKAASVVRLLRCGSCRAHRPVLILDVVTGLDGGKGSQKECARLAISPEAADALILAIGERSAQPAGAGAAAS